MKRELTPEEKTNTEKGLERLKKEIAELEEAKNMVTRQKEFLMFKRSYEDFIRPYNQREQDKQIDKALKNCESDLKMKMDTIKELQKHLEEGVEVKDNPAVQ